MRVASTYMDLVIFSSSRRETNNNDNHTQCEKHAKKEEALEKLRNGTKFDEVAREFSEDKARQGMYSSAHGLCSFHLFDSLRAILGLVMKY